MVEGQMGMALVVSEREHKGEAMVVREGKKGESLVVSERERRGVGSE